MWQSEQGSKPKFLEMDLYHASTSFCWSFGILVVVHLFCSLILCKAVLMFLLIQHRGLDLCRSRDEKAPWKELSNLWSVHFLLVVLYVILDKIPLKWDVFFVKRINKGIYQQKFEIETEKTCASLTLNDIIKHEFFSSVFYFHRYFTFY